MAEAFDNEAEQRVPPPQIQAEQPAPVERAAPDPRDAELEQLRSYYQQTAPTLERLQPYADDIRSFVENEDDREFYRQAREARKRIAEAQAPQIDPSLKPVLDKFEPVAQYVNDLQRREAEAAQRAQQETAQAQWSHVQSLARDHSWLAENNYAAAFDVAAYGDRRGIKDFDKAFDAYRQEMTGRFNSAPASPPPRSLRADAGNPGVPGPKAPGPITSQADIRTRLAAALRSQRAV
jgi:DNA repair ATPase RecN